MFAKATRKFVGEIDPDGCLIPVSRLNETDNLTILSVVIKRNPFWVWQEPKYIPTDFTLNDVLLGDNPISPGVIEADFLNYKGTVETNTTGQAEGDIGSGNLTIKAKGSSKLASSFGRLKKEEVDVQKLLCDCKDRRLDFQHSLVKQALPRNREVFALVKERIITTQPCTVTEEVQKGGSCSSFLGFTVPKKIQVSVNSGGHNSDSNIFLEIPPNTALAYSLMELSVNSTGQFDLCLIPDNYGCFEVDGLKTTNTNLLYSAPPKEQIQKLHNELDELQVQFRVLSGLPARTRSCLFQQITLLLRDKAAINALDLALEDLHSGRVYDPATLDKVPSSKKTIQTTMMLLKETEETDHTPLESVTITQSEPSALTATKLLTSALEEMTESNLKILESCCCCPTIHALHLLVKNVLENKECSLKDSILAPLADNDTYSKVHKLFESSSMMLSKEEDVIQTKISSQQENFPLVLCIVIFGLASLAFTTE